jgi:hypothetical protein
VLADCTTPRSLYAESYQRYGAKVQIMATNGDSQFSEEDSGMILGLAVAGLIVFILMATIGFRIVSEISEYSLEVFQNPLAVVSCSLGMIFAKIILQEGHLIIYSFNGTGFFPFKFMATYIFVMA